jgi:hypothetical protein
MIDKIGLSEKIGFVLNGKPISNTNNLCSKCKEMYDEPVGCVMRRRGVIDLFVCPMETKQK